MISNQIRCSQRLQLLLREEQLLKGKQFLDAVVAVDKQHRITPGDAITTLYVHLWLARFRNWKIN